MKQQCLFITKSYLQDLGLQLFRFRGILVEVVGQRFLCKWFLKLDQVTFIIVKVVGDLYTTKKIKFMS